jgi:UDP-2,4-diacetamido-2,4,6-trideoxy-beta-L-altropyranose hydrolase
LKFLIITSGGQAKKKQLGLGHIFRTLNLVKHLKKNNKIYFLIQDHGGVEKIIETNNFKSYLFKNKSTISSRISETKTIIKKLDIDGVIIDWNKIEKKFIAEVKNHVKTIVITDMKNKEIDADLVINGFIGFKNSIIKNKYNSKCLLGPNFQILNEEFSKTEKYEKKNNILITFGGFDENNITEFVLNELKENEKMKIKVILGPATTKTKKLFQLEKKLSKRIKIIKETKNMCKEIKSSEIGICSGGLTSYEFAACGIPFGIICQVKHQQLAAKEWEKRKIAINLGMPNKKNMRNLNDIIEKLQLKPSRGKKMVDGRGGERVALEINKMFL